MARYPETDTAGGLRGDLEGAEITSDGQTAHDRLLPL
jgi:hypothetical protein